MRNSPKITERNEKIVRHSGSSRYQKFEIPNGCLGKLMGMLKGPNKKFDIVKVPDSEYSRWRMSTVCLF